MHVQYNNLNRFCVDSFGKLGVNMLITFKKADFIRKWLICVNIANTLENLNFVIAIKNPVCF